MRRWALLVILALVGTTHALSGAWHPLSQVSTNAAGTASVDVDGDGTIDASEGLSCTGCINAGHIQDLGISAGDMASNSITSAKIVDGTITSQDIGAGQVTSANLLDGTVASADVAFNYAASASKGGDATGLACTGCVAETEIVQNSLDDSEIEDNSLTALSLAADSVGASELAANSVGDSELFNGGSWTLTSTLNFDSNTLNIDPVNNRVVVGTASSGNFNDILNIGDGINGWGFDTDTSVTNSAYMKLIYPGGARVVLRANQSLNTIYGTSYFDTKIGIGTKTPTYQLHIQSPSHSRILLETQGDSAEIAALYLKTKDMGEATLVKYNTGRLALRTGSNSDLLLQTYSGGSITFALIDDVMKIIPGGLVGIGTSTPATKLDVNGAVRIGQTDSVSFLYHGGIADGTNDVVLRCDGTACYLWPWGTPTTTNKIVLGGGTATDTGISDVLYFTYPLRVGSLTSPTVDNVHIRYYDYGSGNWAGEGVDAGGNWYLRTGTTVEHILRFLQSGAITRDGVTIHAAPSDINLKENIRPLGSVLGKIEEIDGVYFDWKDDLYSDRTEIGLIAQDVEEKFPELVDADDNGVKVLNYPQLTAVLVEATKELKAENEALREDLDELRDAFCEMSPKNCP